MSSPTARDIISGALRLLGVIASGEPLGASEATDGLSSLNDMIDSWSNENLMIPNKVREVFALTGGKQSYTMGTGGDFSSSRSMWIEKVLVQLNSGASTLELPVKILTKDQFAGIILKQTQSTYPLYVYAEGTNPLETLNFWPIPQQANNVVIYSAKALAQLTTLTTALALPPGYSRALRYNLALELASEYGRAVPETVLEIAMASRAVIKRVNTEPQYLQVDNALRANTSTFNWYTGEPT